MSVSSPLRVPFAQCVPPSVCDCLRQLREQLGPGGGGGPRRRVRTARGARVAHGSLRARVRRQPRPLPERERLRQRRQRRAASPRFVPRPLGSAAAPSACGLGRAAGFEADHVVAEQSERLAVERLGEGSARSC